MTRKPTPFDEIERLFDRMSEQFQDVEEWSAIESAWPGRLKVDVAEFDGSFEVTADLPGFETDDIEVELVDEQLRISAESETEESEEEPGRYVKRERRERSVDRRVSLPAPVEADAVEASFKNGVLTVCLPKAEAEEDAHRIDIE
jgi:HSP20 family protein